jgi:hypothetical protein
MMMVVLHAVGWGCYGMGLGRKADEDPEPGRCRRVDGKKWRCSKEAYPGSKYCEKHMHRGKNRSRKPVKMSLATLAPPSSTAATTATSSPVPSYPMPYSARYGGSPYTASAARQGADACQVNPFHLHLDATHPPPPSASSYYAVDRRKKYAYGDVAKPEAGEHAFHSDGGQWQFKQVGVDTKPSATSLFPDGGYGHNGASSSSYAVDMTRTKEDEEERRRHQQQHCFVLGADLRLEKPSNHDVSEVQKPLRPFFDEWPHEKRSKGSWIGFGGETQLSIAIPMAANDPPVTSRYLNGALTA